MTQKTGKAQFTITVITFVLCLTMQAFAQDASTTVKPKDFSVVPSLTVKNQVDISIDLSNVKTNLKLKDVGVGVVFYGRGDRRVGTKLYHFNELDGGKIHSISQAHTFANARSLEGTLFWNGAYALGQYPGDDVKAKLYSSTGKVPIASSDNNIGDNAPTTPGKATIKSNLAAPTLLSPAVGAEFNNYPRKLTLKWKASPGAVSYTVEWDCFHCCQRNQWCSKPDKPWQMKAGLTATSYSFNFSDANPGRWRVWAVGADGKPGPKSEWRKFTFTK